MSTLRWLTFICPSVAALVFATGCNRSEDSRNTLTLATTTSTQDSGLLDVLVPRFRGETGIEVKVVAVGSGHALTLGRRGDVDILLTHAPAAEQSFMDEGWGQERRPLMHNDFILVGPKSDPAMVRGQPDIVAAFRSLADRSAPFVSRGDESGTHQKEMEIWKKAERIPEGDWYIRAGGGMAEALRIAEEKQAYTLADRGTFLALRKELDLELVSEGDALLKNNYSVIVINPKKHSNVNVVAAEEFADFLTAPATKELIAKFGADRFGEPLFTPE